MNNRVFERLEAFDRLLAEIRIEDMPPILRSPEQPTPCMPVRCKPAYKAPTKKTTYYMDCMQTQVEEAFKKQKIRNEEVKKSNISSQLSENYGNLMDNDDLKDFVLKCAGEEIRVHKCILAARSPVFATMFKSDMEEAKDNSADIVDVEPGILRKLLKFIYSGQIDDFTNEEAGDLLYAANKYQLDNILKEECILSLKQNLSGKNVFDAIKFGDLFDKGLKDRAMDFVMKHGSFAELRETEGWKSLHAANPALAVEITTAIVDHMQKQCCCKLVSANVKSSLPHNVSVSRKLSFFKK